MSPNLPDETLQLHWWQENLSYECFGSYLTDLDGRVVRRIGWWPSFIRTFQYKIVWCQRHNEWNCSGKLTIAVVSGAICTWSRLGEGATQSRARVHKSDQNERKDSFCCDLFVQLRTFNSRGGKKRKEGSAYYQVRCTGRELWEKSLELM